MPTPLFAKDPEFVMFMKAEYRRMHELDPAFPEKRYTKKEARRSAFWKAVKARKDGLI